MNVFSKCDAFVRTNRRAVGMRFMFVPRPSRMRVHCDHTVHSDDDLSLWLDSPMFYIRRVDWHNGWPWATLNGRIARYLCSSWDSCSFYIYVHRCFQSDVFVGICFGIMVTSNVTAVTEVRSASFGPGWLQSAVTKTHVMLQLFLIVKCGIVRFLCAMRVF